MDFFTYRISLDMNESTSQSFLNVRKSDSARKLLFTLSDNGKAYQIGSGCTAVFRAKKPDGTILYNNCSINGNVIEYEITNQTISAEGIVECEVTLYGDDGRQITSPRFNIVVNDTIYADVAVESQNEFTQLTQAILGANNLNIDVERSGEGTVITITKKDGTSEQVIVSKVFSLNVFVITETEVVTNKTYAEIKAAIDAGDIIYITDKNDIVYVPQVAKTNTAIEMLWVESHYNITLCWAAVVDSENTWSVTVHDLADTDKLGNLSALKTQADDNLVAAINEVKQTTDTKQDKLIAGENITIAADGKTISATGGGSTVELDTTLTQSGKAADAKVVGDRFDSLSEEKVSLPVDAEGNVINGTAGWYAVSDGAGGIIWVQSAPSGGGETTTHGIVWNLVNVSSSNNAASVADGASLVAVLTPADGYTLGTPTITMGGVVITGAWNADTSTITIPSVTGDVMISCSGVEQTGPVDTSPVIAAYNMSLSKSGGDHTTNGGCYTDFYTIPEGATNVTLYMADAEDVAFGAYGKLQFWDDTKQLDYWTPASKRNQEFSYVIADGATRFRTSLATNGIEDSYAYDSATGYIYFAGKNTQYYGMTNINGSTGGESAVSVAAEVDNQIAMLSLTTGETVDTSAYSGLSSDYVAMVQANYNAMMADCLGDYNKIPLIVHTDQHGRIGASSQVMKLIGDIVNWYEVSKCINLGDTVGNTFSASTLQNYLDATKDSIPLSKRLDVYGNHDVWDSDDSKRYTVDQKRLSPYFKNIYARRHGNNGYFTVFDDYYNVKYLVISDLEYPDTNYSTRRITTAQAKFIVSELSADDGRDVVLVSHAPLDSDEVTSRDSTYQAYSEKFLSDTTAHNSFMAMLSARKSKTSGTFTDSEGISHAYDFSNVSGDLLMSLHGHAHFEAYRTFENSITEFIFDWFDGNTFYFAYIDRKEKKFKVWKNEANVGALEISIA